MLPAHCLHTLFRSGIKLPACVSTLSFTLLLVQSYARLLRLTDTAHCCKTREALLCLALWWFSTRGVACCRASTS